MNSTGDHPEQETGPAERSDPKPAPVMLAQLTYATSESLPRPGAATAAAVMGIVGAALGLMGARPPMLSLAILILSLSGPGGPSPGFGNPSFVAFGVFVTLVTLTILLGWASIALLGMRRWAWWVVMLVFASIGLTFITTWLWLAFFDSGFPAKALLIAAIVFMIPTAYSGTVVLLLSQRSVRHAIRAKAMER
jgi:hypothetical protein